MKLGEQWIEIIDGVEHMVKAVGVKEGCLDCSHYHQEQGCTHDEGNGHDCYITKDLGVLKDGYLPDVYGKYPSEEWRDSTMFEPRTLVVSTKDAADNNDTEIYQTVYVKCNGYPPVYMRERARNAWNRRFYDRP